MTEFWQWFLIVGAGLIFAIKVVDAVSDGLRYLKHGKKKAEEILDEHVIEVVQRDRKDNCPWLLNSERETSIRTLEMKLLKESIIAELQPIKLDIAEIKDLNKKLYHAQMTDLQIKLTSLFQDRFDKKGVLNKVDQANWDKWFSDYTALGGNSDIKRMDELIQKARLQSTLDKVSRTKKEKEEEIDES